jgi:hypothetical protein
MNKYKGSTVDSFFEKEGLLKKIEAIAIKRVIACKFKKKTKQFVSAVGGNALLLQNKRK